MRVRLKLPRRLRPCKVAEPAPLRGEHKVPLTQRSTAPNPMSYVNDDVWACIFDRLDGRDIVNFRSTGQAARDTVDRYATFAYGAGIPHRHDMNVPRLTFDKWHYETSIDLPRTADKREHEIRVANMQGGTVFGQGDGDWTDEQQKLLLATYRPANQQPGPQTYADLLDATGRPMEAVLCRRAARGEPHLLAGLQAATSQGTLAAVQYALANGVSPNTPGQLGRTRLLTAAEVGDAPAVQLLLEAGANPAPGAGITAAQLAGNEATRLALRRGPAPQVPVPVS